MELTNKDTKMIKALCVLAMLCLHLFDNTAYPELYTPIVYLFGKPLTFFLGQVSDFCVMGFAFCSGYAHYAIYKKTAVKDYYVRRLKALLSLYVNFWIILLLFSIISFGIGEGSSNPGSLFTFLGNVTTVKLTYNGAWWYIFTFAILVIISPVLMLLTQKVNGFLLLLISGIIYCIAFWIRFRIKTDSWVLYQFGLLGMTLFEYQLGTICCRYHIFDKCKKIMSSKNSLGITLITTVLLIAVFLARTLLFPSIVFAPVSGIVIIFLFWYWNKPAFIERSFLFVGEHSTNIWLTHMFFYAVIFKDFVYCVRYPVLVYALMLAVTIGGSLVINLVYQPIDRLIRK